MNFKNRCIAFFTNSYRLFSGVVIGVSLVLVGGVGLANLNPQITGGINTLNTGTDATTGQANQLFEAHENDLVSVTGWNAMSNGIIDLQNRTRNISTNSEGILFLNPWANTAGDVYVGNGTLGSTNLRVHGMLTTTSIKGGNAAGNLHLDSSISLSPSDLPWEHGNSSIYLNWYGGAGGVVVGDGNSGYGIIGASQFNPSSDARLKRNIKGIDNALQTISALNPVSYEKRGSLETDNYNIKENGFIAQELQKILPDLVSEGSTKDKLLGVNYNAIIPVLTKAIQELFPKFDALFAADAWQQQQIDTLKKENQAQSQQISDLKALVCLDHPTAKVCQ
ncbi:MAG: tail fiber domain-containing protein [Candidatus Peregrinibacteria bacterium]